LAGSVRPFCVQAKWIWISRTLSPNTYGCIWKNFRLGKMPSRCALRVVTRAFYRLSINGREIGFNLDRPGPNLLYYDSFDIRPHLRPGENTIAFLLYGFGIEPAGVIGLTGGTGGLLFSGEAVFPRPAEARLIYSDRTCRVRRVRAWKQRTGIANEFTGAYREVLDVRRLDDWTRPESGRRPWRHAVEIHSTGADRGAGLLPRIVPFLTESPAAAENIYTIGSGTSYGFSETAWEVNEPSCLRPAFQPGRARSILQQGEATLPGLPARSHDSVTVVGPGPGGASTSLLLDFGRVLTGRVFLRCSDVAAGTRLQIGYGESPHITYADSVRLAEGVNAATLFQRKTFRYLLCTFYHLKKPLRLHQLQALEVAYPVKERGTFDCCDPRLVRIHDVCRQTIKPCMQDRFWDGPAREQLLWLGDLWPESLIAQSLFGETGLTKKCLLDAAATQDKTGMISSRIPGNSLVLYDFPFFWIFTLRDYYWYTGDVDLVRELYGATIKLISWYAARCGKDGLLDIGRQPEYWCFVDWGLVEKRGKVCYLNILLAGALGVAAELAEVVGLPVDAQELRARERRLRIAVNQTFWSEEQGGYIDCASGGKRSTHTSRQTNAMAVLWDICDRKQAVRLARRVLAAGRYREVKTAFMNFVVAGALFKLEHDESAVNLVRDYWGEMIARGATTFWESFDPESPAGMFPEKLWSLCHGFSAGPARLFAHNILGVRPLTPGFSRVQVRPALGGLAYASGDVPTPRGIIRVAWRNEPDLFRLRIEYPRNIEVTPAIPMGARKKKFEVKSVRF